MARIKQMEQKEQIGARVPPVVKAALEQIAEAEDRTVSQVVLRIIEQWPEVKERLDKTKNSRPSQ